jgi:uncharacterized protein (DUF362 family)
MVQKLMTTKSLASQILGETPDKYVQEPFKLKVKTQKSFIATKQRFTILEDREKRNSHLSPSKSMTFKSTLVEKVRS